MPLCSPSSRSNLGFFTRSTGSASASVSSSLHYFFMGGAIKQLLSLLGAVSGGHRDSKRRMQRQTVELRVRMDCERCEREVKKALDGMRGVQRVEVNRRQQKVTVTGNVDPTGKKAETWPRNPSYSAAAVANYYGLGAAQSHDRWAPACSQRNVEAIAAEHITSLFGDDHPNACSIM